MTRPVTFTFDGDVDFDGVTDDTYWNGFLNVRVTPEVRDQIVRWLRVTDVNYTLYEYDAALADLQPGDDGLINLGGGWATMESTPVAHCSVGDHPITGDYIVLDRDDRGGVAVCVNCLYELDDRDPYRAASLREAAEIGVGHKCVEYGVVAGGAVECELCGLIQQDVPVQP